MMKKLCFFLAVFTIAYFPVTGQVVQNWVNVFSYENITMGEIAYDNAVDSQRNVYVCGQTGLDYGTDYDAVALKISAEGETLWYHVFGDDAGTNNWGDVFDDLVLDEANDAVYFAGEYCPPANPLNTQIYLVKMSLEGEVIYEKTYSSGYGNALIMGDDGNLYLSGVKRISEWDYSLYLAKVDPASGDAIWESAPTPGGMDGGGMGLCCDDDGNIYQAGMLDDDWAVVKYDPAGNVVWYDKYNSSNFPGGWFPVARFITYAGGMVYATGTVKEINGNDMRTACYSTDGDLLWSDIYDGGYDFEVSEGIEADGEGNIIVVGYSFTSETASNELVFKYSATGDSLWFFVNNVNGKEEGARGVVVDDENNVYVTGYRQNTTDEYPDDYLTQKFSGESGELMWEFVFNREGTTDEANTICLFDVNDVFVSGRSHTWSTWYDIVTVNYSDTLHTSVAQFSMNDVETGLRIYPNPFVDQTTVSWTLPEFTSSCTVMISNLLGQNVKTFTMHNLQSGDHSVVWQKEFAGKNRPDKGIYFCKLIVNGKCCDVKKLVSAR